MPVIALTGGIATGKSTVARMLTEHGAVIVDADRLARDVVAPGTEGLAAVVAHFGNGVLRSDGALDREKLGATVFSDPAERRVLEAITHPRIKVLSAQRVADALAEEAPLVVVDIPLLFEAGDPDAFPGILLAYADAATQLERLLARDGLDETAARLRLDAQLPIDEKRDRATWIVDNSGDIEHTRAQVAAWWRDHGASS